MWHQLEFEESPWSNTTGLEDEASSETIETSRTAKLMGDCDADGPTLSSCRWILSSNLSDTPTVPCHVAWTTTIEADIGVFCLALAFVLVSMGLGISLGIWV